MSASPTRYANTLRWDDRQRMWAEATGTTYDIIVVGGGITGAGVALDAASRGLSTLLVERVDIAAGTSRWSSKLCHGGLRYLAKAQIGVAWESARERHWLMTQIAPHLATPRAFLIPLNDGTKPLMGILSELGVRGADVMRLISGTPNKVLPMPRRLKAKYAAKYAPGLKRDGLRGGVLYWDGQLEDDARLTTAIVRTAVGNGAQVITRCAVDEASDNQMQVTDTIDGKQYTLNAKAIINATGVWANELEDTLEILPSRGSHIVVRSERLGNPQAVFTAPVPGTFGRYVFAIPKSDGLCLIGLTDEPAIGADGIKPEVPEDDVQFLLDCINQDLAEPLTKDDIVGEFAGLRPLVTEKNGPKSTADVSRRHLLIDKPGSPITIAGGKLTTYRKMAEDAVDAACRRIGTNKKCRTRTLPLVGAAKRSVLNKLTVPEHIVNRYGTEAELVMQMGKDYPSIAGPISDDIPTYGEEFLFAIAHEGALSIEDVIERRTRISTVNANVEPARKVAAEAFALLGMTPIEDVPRQAVKSDDHTAS